MKIGVGIGRCFLLAGMRSLPRALSENVVQFLSVNLFYRMDLSLLIDVLIVAIGVAGTVVLVVLLWRSLNQNQQEEGGSAKLVLNPRSTMQKISRASSFRVSRAIWRRKQTGLKAVHLSLQGADKILLQLQNQGDTLLIDRIQTGSNNELLVESDPPLRSPKGHKYGPNTKLNLLLKGDKVIFKTYQFWVYYRNREGQQFRQQVAGLGREFPIIESAERLPEA